MINVVDAHNYLEKFCENNPGIAIGDEIFLYFVKQAVDLANKNSNIIFPTTNQFYNMPISFKGKIDASALTVILDSGIASPHQEPPPLVILANVGFELEIQLSGTTMSVHNILYDLIEGGISVKPNRIALTGKRSIGNWTSEREIWKTMTKLPDNSDFTPDKKDKWRVQEEAIKMVAKDVLGPTLLEAVEIPNIIKMVSCIKFSGPVRIGGQKNILMFSGPAEWLIDCPRRPAQLHGHISNPLYDSSDTTLVPTISNSDAPGGSYPPMPEPPSVTAADIFIFLPKVFVEKRFDGVVKPAVGYVDDGYVGPIYWHYESAIAVNKLQLTMTNLWPLEFKIDLPSNAFGSAGAGVKAGCVYVEAAGAAFNGKIDPLEIYFKIGQDLKQGEMYFESRFGKINPNSFQFMTSPALDFPLEQIKNFILARVQEMLIAGKTGEILNVTRFSLVEFGLVRGFGKMQPGMAAQKATDGTSVTVGVSFVK